jgi:tRNA-2-methylthio-N6-dimethylallyladenosine synthase
MGRRYLIRTFGCQMNEHDSERIAGMLDASGFEPAAAVGDADIVLFNTCCIRENADQRLYGQLGALAAEKQRRPDLKVVVGGCLAQKDGAGVVERAGHVDIVFGTHNLARLPALLDAADAGAGPVVEITDETEVFPSTLPARRDLSFTAWVTISIGCNNSCTFCIVPKVRGPEVSRRPGDIIAEVDRLAADGVVEVTLLGQNVNSYGRDLHGRRPQFAELLRAVDAVEGIERIRFTSPHPKDLRSDTIDAMAASPAVCEQLHLPAQSGSDRILAAMHRGYTAERFLGRLAKASDAIPDLTVSTDLIVGFPGESEADFEDTLAFVAAARFDSAYTFIYSPRPGTAAAALDDPVPAAEKQDRYRRLTELQDSISWARNLDLVGTTQELLVEGPSKRDPRKLTGRTRGGKLCHFPDDGTPPGSFRRVTVTAAAPHYLMGEPCPV